MCSVRLLCFSFNLRSGKLRATSSLLGFIPMSTWSRPVVLLFCGLLLLTIAIAVLNTLVPLWLTHDALTT
nr:Serine--tRNA ligase [Candidatus Pantoea persica]